MSGNFRFPRGVLVLGNLLFSVLASPFATADSDPLFQKMEGKWVGHGVRNYPISGRQVTVDAEVQTSSITVGGLPALLSQNQITESVPNSAPRTYSTVYWVQPLQGQPGSYALGAQGSTQAGSSGVLGADGVFRVEQNLGGGSTPYVVKSETQFFGDHTVYSDTFTIGTVVQSQTQIDYQRATP
jgi:hypothetical protein